MKPSSCGFLIHNTVDDTYLLCHATQQPNTLNFGDRFWTIPKGMQEPGESYLDCAIRETFEETNINLLNYYTIDELNACTSVVLHGHRKFIHAFILKTQNKTLTDFSMKCNSMINNPALPHVNGLPEIDAFGWFYVDECRNLVFPSLVPLFS